MDLEAWFLSLRTQKKSVWVGMISGRQQSGALGVVTDETVKVGDTVLLMRYIESVRVL